MILKTVDVYNKKYCSWRCIAINSPQNIFLCFQHTYRIILSAFWSSWGIPLLWVSLAALLWLTWYPESIQNAYHSWSFCFHVNKVDQDTLKFLWTCFCVRWSCLAVFTVFLLQHVKTQKRSSKNTSEVGKINGKTLFEARRITLRVINGNTYYTVTNIFKIVNYTPSIFTILCLYSNFTFNNTICNTKAMEKYIFVSNI